MIYFQVGVVVVETCLAAAITFVLLQTLRPSRLDPPSDTRRRAGNFFIYLAALIFIGSGVSKFLHVPLAVTEMTLLGLTGGKYVVVASLEIFCGILLLIRPLRSVALPFVSAHMGGAITAHIIADQIFAVLPSAIILSLCWLGMFLRHPQILWSLSDYAASTKKSVQQGRTARSLSEAAR